MHQRHLFLIEVGPSAQLAALLISAQHASFDVEETGVKRFVSRLKESTQYEFAYNKLLLKNYFRHNIDD